VSLSLVELLYHLILRVTWFLLHDTLLIEDFLFIAFTFLYLF